MNPHLDPGWPVIKRIANICAFSALLPLVSMVEWVPGLLPRSPNLAYSQDPRISSIWFPLIAGGLGLLGFLTWYWLRRLNRLGLAAFGVFWTCLYACIFLLASMPVRLDVVTIGGAAIMLAMPIYFARVLLLNWQIALRSNKSLERARNR